MMLKLLLCCPVKTPQRFVKPLPIVPVVVWVTVIWSVAQSPPSTATTGGGGAATPAVPGLGAANTAVSKSNLYGKKKLFLKLVQCQSRLNHKIQPYLVEGIHFTHN